MKITLTRKLIPDTDTQVSDFPYGQEDSESYNALRVLQFERDRWSFVGVVAQATLHFPYGADTIEATLSSPGLWGVESDSSEHYLESVYDEERAILIEMIEAFAAGPHEFVEE
jgi:hypothetical protein